MRTPPTIADHADARRALRAFAAEWPGGLKELDTLDSDEIKATFKKLGAEATQPSPQEVVAFVADEHDRIRRIVRATGAKSE